MRSVWKQAARAVLAISAASMLLTLPAQAKSKKKSAEKKTAAAQVVFDAAEHAQDPLAFLPDDTGWRSLYLNWLATCQIPVPSDSTQNVDPDQLYYWVDYLNGDSVPELFLEDRWDGMVYLYTVRNGAVTELASEYEDSFSYTVGGDALVTTDLAGTGVYRESVSNAESGEIAAGTRTYSPFDDSQATFEINGQEVTEAAYNAYFDAFTESGTRRDSGDLPMYSVLTVRPRG
ncbi:MAG: hypothetical protein ACI4OJ_08650 [Lachnospiraceae bacterium]